MRKTFVSAAGLLFAALCVVSLGAQSSQPDPNLVVLKVNDKDIHFWEVAVMIPQVQMEMVGQGAQPKREEVIQIAMKRVVDIRLLAEEARKRGLKPDQARVDAAMAQLVEQAGGRANFDASLAQIGVSPDQLKSNAALSDLVRSYITTTIDPQVTVSAEEVEAFYNQNPETFERPDMIRARHIIMRITQGADQAEKDSAKARATAAHKRVIRGEDFAAVAKEVSEGRNAASGGDLGFFAQDSMVPALSNAAFALDIGEISAVVESQFGYHIVKVEEKRPASKMPFEEAKEPIEQMLRENKAGQKVAEVLAALTEAATIVEVPPPAELQSGQGGG
jgi:peptidyl-prolyl cis-trans isomerase C